MLPVISLDNVSVEFDSRYLRNTSLFGTLVTGVLGQKKQRTEVITALSRVNLSIFEGDRLGILGANGAGKTTLLRTISGIYRPTSGHVEARGHVAPLIDLGLGLNLEASGLQNLHMMSAVMGYEKAALKSRLQEIISFSGLGERIHSPVKTYSSGMVARLGFSLTLLLETDILVLDEWLAVGDDDFRQRAQKKLAEIIESSKALVLASHSPETILRVCTRAVLLDQGQIVMDGDPDKVLREYSARG